MAVVRTVAAHRTAARTAPGTDSVAGPGDSGRDRIMDEAAGLFLARGYDATSLRHIADAVGMKAGSIYYHFASKDDLLTEILRRGIDVMQAAFDEAEAAMAVPATSRGTNSWTDNSTHSGTAVSAQRRIGAHVRAHLAALFENGPYTAAHVMTFRTAPAEVREQIVPIRDAYEARWTELLQAMQADGLISQTIEVHVARLILFGAMNSSVEWFDQDRGNLDVFAAAITAQFWNGVST